MSQIDKLSRQSASVNKRSPQLNKQNYQKICEIRDRVTEIAAKIQQRPQADSILLSKLNAKAQPGS